MIVIAPSLSLLLLLVSCVKQGFSHRTIIPTVRASARLAGRMAGYSCVRFKMNLFLIRLRIKRETGSWSWRELSEYRLSDRLALNDVVLFRRSTAAAAEAIWEHQWRRQKPETARSRDRCGNRKGQWEAWERRKGIVASRKKNESQLTNEQIEERKRFVFLSHTQIQLRIDSWQCDTNWYVN